MAGVDRRKAASRGLLLCASPLEFGKNEFKGCRWERSRERPALVCHNCSCQIARFQQKTGKP
jgi:hypothetical protein